MTTPRNETVVQSRWSWIADTELFRELVTEAVARFDTAAEAAEAMVVTPGLVTRLRQGEIGRRVTASVVRAMRVAFKGDARALARLDAALLSDAERAALNTHRDWKATMAGRLHGANHLFASLVLPTESGTHPSSRQYATRGIGDIIRKSAKRLEKRGHAPYTIDRAIMRALEPLADAEHAGGIELTFDELVATRRFGAYLKVALRREEFLLSRTPDLVRRAKEVTARPTKAGPREAVASLRRPALGDGDDGNDSALIERMVQQKAADNVERISSALRERGSLEKHIAARRRAAQQVATSGADRVAAAPRAKRTARARKH